MKNNQSKFCAFCVATPTKENRSKEHIFPQWLSDFLKIREEKIQQLTGVTVKQLI